MIQEPLTLPEGTIIQGANGTCYIIERLLGTGGFSAVYRVRDRRARHHIYALKEIADPDDRERRHLIIEAELLKRLEHPSLPCVHQILRDPQRNRIYMLMDYIEGKDLEALRREQNEKRFSPGAALSLLAPIVDAISYLHAQQPPVVHRDIKPANIIVPDNGEKPKLVDFGLAKEHVEDKTTNVFRYGTPGYAAPEQYGQGTSPRTDIYALGATFYVVLTGTIPIDALTRSLEREENDPLPLAHGICPTIPETISRVLERAMRLRSEERFESIETFWQAMSLAALRYIPEHSPLPKLSSTHLKTTPPKQASSTSTGKLADNTQKEQSTVRVYRPGTPSRITKKVGGMLIGLLIIFLAIDALLFFLWWRPTPENAVYAQTPIAGTQTQLPTAQPSPTPATPGFITCPTSSPALPSNPGYPILSTCYGGTISNQGISSTPKTALYLWEIKQEQGNISGKFQGLGMIGTFQGTVTQDSQISFIVELLGSRERFLFEGHIRLGGDLVFSYSTINQTDEKTFEEYGNGTAQNIS